MHIGNPNKKVKGGVYKVTLEISNYVCKLSPDPLESAPEVRLWVDANFSRKPVRVALDPDDPSKVYSVTVKGRLYEDMPIPTNAVMGIQGFCRSYSELGVKCLVETGTDFAYLSKLVEGSQHSVSLKMRSAGNLEKGTFDMRVKKVSSEMSFQIQSPVDRPVTLSDRRISKRIASYIDNVLQIQKRTVPERSAVMETIKVPAYLGEVGFEMTGEMPLPAAAFVMKETPKINLEFVENAFSNALARHGLHLSDYKRLSLMNKARVMLSVCVMGAQGLPYIGDSVFRSMRREIFRGAQKSGAEIFADSSVTGAGDCEDDGQYILDVHMALVYNDLGDDIPTEIAEIQGLARSYVSMLTLASVTAAAVSDADENGSIGAHMFDILIPVNTFKRALDRGSPGVSSRLNFTQWDGIQEHERDMLCPMILEGTGQFQSQEKADELKIYRQYVYQALDRMKKPIVHQVGTDSGFYRSVLTAFTPSFWMSGSRQLGFWFTDSNGIRGANVEDMEAGMENFTIKAHPPIPKDVMQVMEQAVRVRIPPTPLVLTADIAEPYHNKWADLLVKEVNRLGREFNSEGAVVSAYIHSEYFEKRDVEDIMSKIRQLPAVYRVDYMVERYIDDHTPLLRFNFYSDLTLDPRMASMAEYF